MEIRILFIAKDNSDTFDFVELWFKKNAGEFCVKMSKCTEAFLSESFSLGKSQISRAVIGTVKQKN